MAVTFYDNLPINQDIVLDWPLSEGLGSLVHDRSKSEITGTLHGTMAPLWAAATGQPFYGIYLFNTWNQYASAPAADTANLDFTSGDYALSCWLNWQDYATSQIVMGKYVVDVRGWEVYLFKAGALDYLTVRHHHAGGLTNRTASYSLGWTPGTLHLFGVDRIGTAHQHYRNGQPIPTVSSVLIDPVSSAASDLVVGIRYTLDVNKYRGYIGRPRAWSRALGAAGHRQLFAQGNAQ